MWKKALIFAGRLIKKQTAWNRKDLTDKQAGLVALLALGLSGFLCSLPVNVGPAETPAQPPPNPRQAQVTPGDPRAGGLPQSDSGSQAQPSYRSLTSTLPSSLPGEATPSPDIPPTPPAFTASPIPSPTASPVSSPSPQPGPVLIQLTSGGCCVQPFWSPEGQKILFIDKPAPDAPSGIWGVSRQGGAPELVAKRPGIYSADWRLLAYPEGGITFVENVEDGQRWSIANGGREVTFSPDGSQVAWTGGASGPPYDTVRRQVWVSQVDGSQAHPVIETYGGGFAGWFPDGRLLVSGRLSLAESGQALWAVHPDAQNGAQPRELARGPRLHGATISPGGGWLAYAVTFAEDPDENGLWVVNVNSGEKKRLDVFGAYRWRNEGQLLVAPLELGEPWHRFLEVEVGSGQTRALTNPSVTPFKIANNDWAVAPDGSQIVFVSAEDLNLWLLDLP